MTPLSSVVAAILITVGCVLAPLALLAVWAGNEVADTDRYVENVTPLAADPNVQNAVANRATSELMSLVGASDSSNRLVAGLESVVRTELGKVVQSSWFATFWVDANRVAHTQLDAVLSGEGTASVQVSGDAVSLDLGPLIARVKQRLVDAGLTIASNIPDVNPTFVLFESADLTKYQTLYGWLNVLKWALPILSVALIAAGVLTAKGRRRALIGAGLGLTLAMLVLGAALVVARGRYLDGVAQRGIDQPAAADLFDTLIRFARTGLWVVLVAGLVLAAAAFLAGRVRRAV